MTRSNPFISSVKTLSCLTQTRSTFVTVLSRSTSSFCRKSSPPKLLLMQMFSSPVYPLRRRQVHLPIPSAAYRWSTRQSSHSERRVLIGGSRLRSRNESSQEAEGRLQRRSIPDGSTKIPLRLCPRSTG